MRAASIPAVVLVSCALSSVTYAQQFGQQELVDSRGELWGLGHADIDGDNDQDLVVALLSDRLNPYWYENDGAGSFSRVGPLLSSPLPGQLPLFQLSFDADGDGDEDLVFADTFTGLYLAENLGNAQFGPLVSLPSNTIGVGGPRPSCQVIDIDRDGDADLLVQDFWDNGVGGAYWVEQTSPGAFAGPHYINQMLGPMSTVAVDIDQDSYLDVVTIDFIGDVFISMHDPGMPGSFLQKQLFTSYGTSSDPHFDELVLADFDGDGITDLLVEDYSGGRVFAHRATGSSLEANATVILQDYKSIWLRAAHLNSDSQVDYLYSQDLSPADLVLNTGLGSLETVDVGNNLFYRIVDIDQDGDRDIVGHAKFGGNLADGTIVLYRNLGTIDADSDDDGISDQDEVTVFGTDPNSPDSDGDLVWDGTELGVTTPTPDTNLDLFRPDKDPLTTTDPLLPDTDGGGVQDGVEDQNQDGALDSWETDPNLAGDEDLAFYVRDLKPGMQVKFEAYNATAFQTLAPAYSVVGPGPTALGIGVTVDLSQPIKALPPVLADAQGQASWRGPLVPSGAGLGISVWLQLLEIPFTGGGIRVSNSILLPVGSN